MPLCGKATCDAPKLPNIRTNSSRAQALRDGCDTITWRASNRSRRPPAAAARRGYLDAGHHESRRQTRAHDGLREEEEDKAESISPPCSGDTQLSTQVQEGATPRVPGGVWRVQGI
eukprot:CAMPEP_0176287044 /NCGR_PEP_ID=MMETSP0121_2-20121125/53227_1 /TAXON_ID=160619 /ORGANISM="Kryptoperidinium foliaceum, Strain CCMP 1326" /LENGTH=115 /DNA_ID=CAMNT_0017627637 /DNA_START=39 /DNA_END=383 /DNA_ORIENTATION=-